MVELAAVSPTAGPSHRGQIKLQARVLTSAADLISLEEQWDDLWRRSLVSVPSARSAALVHWLCYFANDRKFRALAIFANGKLVGALPLVEGQIAKFVRVGQLPSNQWSPGGDLLMDNDFALELIAAAMAEILNELPWPVLWLDDVIDERPDWHALHRAFAKHHIAEYHKRFDVGVIRTTKPFDEVRQGWSKNHRRKMSKSQRRLADMGELKLRLETPRGSQVAELMRSGFEVEDLGWKGSEGTSVLKTPGMLTYYTEQAELFAQNGELLLAFLDVGERTIAFEYGWFAKHIYHSFKVGYDPEFATNSPGQVLNERLIEHFCGQPEIHAIDCLGPISEAITSWHPNLYGTGRLVVGAGWKGRLLTTAYRHIWRKWRRSSD